MKKLKKFGTYLMIMALMIMPMVVNAVNTPPAAPSGGGNAPGGTSSTPTYSGATSFTSDTKEESKTYASNTGSQNALLVSGGTCSVTNPTVNKTGDSTDENSDFYGTNAGILVYNGATLNITGGTITTSAGHANAVFAYGTGIINISDATIKTTSNNSGGIMVTGGGTLNATNLTVTTDGNSAASIRSDRGGGNLTVKKGTYTTNGVGSPAIYSTANIKVNDATLTSNSSEGVVIEGANSVTLNNVSLVDNNTSLNGNSETYKNIFIYQSMSGDASEGSGTFSAADSKITTKKGDTFFVTNTTAVINLNNDTFSNTDGDFLRIQTGKWGNSGSNGGNVTLNMTNQKVVGNIIVDNISSLAISLKNTSVLKSAINKDNTAKKITLDLSENSVLVLEDDSYVTSLTNAQTDNSNIYLNGHTLYVNGEKVKGNTGTYTDPTTENATTTTTVPAKETTTDNTNMYIGIGVLLIIIIVLVLFLLKRKNKKKKATTIPEPTDDNNPKL